MMQKAFLVAAAAVALSAGSAMAFPSAPLPVQNATMVQQATFWGRPFPYGYNWSLRKACTRYETVETAHGPRTERVWVCSARWRHYR